MFFYRKNYSGEWITKQLKKDMYEKAIEKFNSIAREMYENVQKNFQDLPEDYKKIIFEKSCPNFNDIASDIIDVYHYKNILNK